MASLINIGMSGLGAAQSGMYTLGNNIANADVESYSRQQNVQRTKGGQQVGQVFMGSGTTLADVRRVYNSFLENQLRTTTSLSSDASSYLEQISPLDTALSGSDTGITAALQSFFSAMQDAAAKPTEDASRQLLLTSAQSLSKRFNTLSAQLNQQNSNINANMASLADQVNNLTKTIAELNEQISRVSSITGQPNDLLDQRDGAVRELNKLIGTDVVERDGNYDIYLKNGQALVLGKTTQTLGVAPSAADPTRMSLILNRGSTKMDITSSTTGGELGGLIRYRSETLDPALNELGRVALVVADAINSQLAQGIDKNGEFGAALFGDINSAKAISERSIAKNTNSAGSGNLDVTIKDTGKLSTSDYQVTFTSATGYSVRKLPEGTDMGSFDLNDTPPPVIDGFTLSLNGGGLSAGDSFKITPTRNAAANIETTLTDPKRLAMAAPLTGTSGSGNKGTGTITQPNLTSKLDIYDSAQRAQLQTGLKYSTPSSWCSATIPARPSLQDVRRQGHRDRQRHHRAGPGQQAAAVGADGRCQRQLAGQQFHLRDERFRRPEKRRQLHRRHDRGRVGRQPQRPVGDRPADQIHCRGRRRWQGHQLHRCLRQAGVQRRRQGRPGADGQRRHHGAAHLGAGKPQQPVGCVDRRRDRQPDQVPAVLHRVVADHQGGPGNLRHPDQQSLRSRRS